MVGSIPLRKDGIDVSGQRAGQRFVRDGPPRPIGGVAKATEGEPRRGRPRGGVGGREWRANSNVLHARGCAAPGAHYPRFKRQEDARKGKGRAVQEG
jgi:hypothetical protein